MSSQQNTAGEQKRGRGRPKKQPGEPKSQYRKIEVDKISALELLVGAQEQKINNCLADIALIKVLLTRIVDQDSKSAIAAANDSS